MATPAARADKDNRGWRVRKTLLSRFDLNFSNFLSRQKGAPLCFGYLVYIGLHPVSPPLSGSRQAAMMPESFLFQTVNIIPKMLHVCIEEALGKMEIGGFLTTFFLPPCVLHRASALFGLIEALWLRTAANVALRRRNRGRQTCGQSPRTLGYEVLGL